MVPIALGDLGMSIDEFEYATAREVVWKLEGHQRAEIREFERMAQLAAWVMNPWLKDPISADELLGRPKITNWNAWLAEK